MTFGKRKFLIDSVIKTLDGVSPVVMREIIVQDPDLSGRAEQLYSEVNDDIYIDAKNFLVEMSNFLKNKVED